MQLNFSLKKSKNFLILTFDKFPDQALNLSELQKDDLIIVRIYQDQQQKKLSIGHGCWLVAEAQLPPISYWEEPVLDEKGNQLVNEYGTPLVKIGKKPLTRREITLKLWELPV